MVWVCYSSSSTYIAFVAALLRLLLFAVLCPLLLWWQKSTPGWFYHPDWGGLNKEGGFIPQKGWLYPPKGVVFSPERRGFILLKSGHKKTRGGFKGGFCLGPLIWYTKGRTWDIGDGFRDKFGSDIESRTNFFSVSVLYLCALYSPCLHQVTMQSFLFKPRTQCR